MLSLRNRAFVPPPSAALRYRFARALATRISGPALPLSPSQRSRVATTSDLLLRMIDSRTLVLIPARMASTRLPGKPLMEIGGIPMIVHVLRRAEEAAIGRV